MTSDPLISLIIPCFNEAQRVKDSLQQTIISLSKQKLVWELVVVDDGSTDNTVPIVESTLVSNPVRRGKITLLKVSHGGKGWAVRNGMLHAQGDYRFISDLDLSVPLKYLSEFVQVMTEGADIVIASRQLKQSRRFDEPKLRFIASRIFNRIIRWILALNVSDSQCGFKGFSSTTARALFSIQRLNGYCFDPEVLFIAKKMKYKVIEAPVIWRYETASKVNLIIDSIKMISDLVRIRIYSILGKYKVD